MENPENETQGPKIAKIYEIQKIAKADAKKTADGELRKTTFLVFPHWMNSDGIPVKFEGREFSKEVAVLLKMVDTPEEIQDLSKKVLYNLTSDYSGLSAHLEEMDHTPADFWTAIVQDLGTEESQDEAFRFFSLVAQETAIENLANADLNKILDKFVEEKREQIQDMRDSAAKFDGAKFKTWAEGKIKANGSRPETIKTKKKVDGKTVTEETVVNYIRVKAAKK